MIEPDKREWSFRDRALNERAMEDYQKIIKQVGRGNLCFSKACWTLDDKSGVSLSRSARQKTRDLNPGMNVG